jgi:hypothetical protein
MGICFVIQPFHGPFNKRFEDVFVPAIQAAGLSAYRVDRDDNVEIPIESIENGIRKADVCLAEITLDNPNVWYELGYAFASQKEVVMVCHGETRPKFPFDVQHRTIITYSSDSPSDFARFEKQITIRIRAILKKQEEIGMTTTLSPIVPFEGLSQHEIACMISIAWNSKHHLDPVYTYTVRQDMDRFGYTPLATNLGLRSLEKKRMILLDAQSSHEASYLLTDLGFEWLDQNQHTLQMKTSPAPLEDVDESDPFADE